MGINTDKIRENSPAAPSPLLNHSFMYGTRLQQDFFNTNSLKKNILYQQI